LQTKVYSSKLIWSINDNKNKSIISDSVEFRVAPESTAEVYSFDATDIIRGREDECYLRFFATDSIGVHSETTCLFVSPRRFKLIDPEIYVDIVGANSDFTLTVSAKAFARAVELAFDPELEFSISDNYFDVTSDVPVRLKLHTERHTAVEILKRTLTVRSLYDIGR
jgi:beta-mannosidase